MKDNSNGNCGDKFSPFVGKVEIMKYRIVFFVFLLIAGFLLHLPSGLGVSLSIPPDSTEYAICLANLFEHGKFGFTINGEWFPSRYAPWFSIFYLSPAYFIFGGDVLALHWSVLAFALAILVFLYKTGHIIGLGKWSILCAVLPLFIPDFVFYSRLTMTEIPYVSLFAASALVFVKFADDESPSLLFCLSVGALVVWCGMARTTALPMLALFVIVVLCKKYDWKRKLLSILVLSIPAVAYIAANLFYNKCVFGSPFRNGYHYWVSVPFDFPRLVFNSKYIYDNVILYLKQPIILIAIIAVSFVAVVAMLMIKGKFGGARKNRSFLLFFGYVIVQGIVLTMLYIGYYWADVRFFLSIVICIIPLFFGAVFAVVGTINRVAGKVVLSAIAVAGIGCFRFVVPRYIHMAWQYPFRIAEAGISREVLPSGAIVVQDGNPIFIDFFGKKGKQIKHLPIYRDRFEHVLSMISSESIAQFEPKPISWRQRVIPELIESGKCKYAIPYTLSERPEIIGALLRQGERVFLHFGISTGYLAKDKKDFSRLLEGYGLKHFGEWTVPAVEPNPVRHIYDSFIFPSNSMDCSPDVWCSYYEVVEKKQ